MSGVSEQLLIQAIDDVIHFYGDDDDLTHDELLCFVVLLNRAKPLDDVALENVLRSIRMYDPILEEDPWVQEYGDRRAAVAEVRAKAEGKAEGEAHGIRQSIEMVVQMRFPDLKELAMERTAPIQESTALQQVLAGLLAAPDERHALRYLQAL
jgi:hypothetical protein